jgi:tetratricopeptide (TPR) repeat protein
LPTRLDLHAPFVGRTSEHAALAAALSASRRDGQRRVTLVSGEPGIGKSTLAARFAREAVADGAIALYGRCDEDLAVPYGPWAEAVSHACHYARTDLLRTHVDARGHELVPLVPDLGQLVDLPALRLRERDSDQYALFGAVVDLLDRLAARAPLVIVLDDLQWADRATLLLLRHFVGVDRASGALVVATYRDSDLSDADALVDTLVALYREPVVDRIPLTGLDAPSIYSLLEETAGHELDDDAVVLRDLLLAETDGNPYFVTETLRHLAETGAIAQGADGRWSAVRDLGSVGLPVTVRDVITRRVARLGADVQLLLGYAAVLGRDFDVDLLRAVSDVDDDVLLDALERATAAAVVRPVSERADRFTFVHALMEHTLYEALGPLRRRRMHGRVADMLSARFGDASLERAGEIAKHWLAADPSTTDALAWVLRAGRQAMGRLAPQDAVPWFTTALELARALGNGEQRCAVLLELGEAQRDAGDGTYRTTLLEAAHAAAALGARDLLVRAALANTRGWASAAGTVDEERVEVLHTALDALDGDDSASRARLLALLAAETSYSSAWQERLRVSDEGVAVARRVGDTATLSYVLARRAHSLWVPDLLEERLANTAENVALTASLGSSTERFWAAMYRVAAVVSAGHGEEIDGHLATMSAIADDRGLPVLRWECTIQHTWRALVTGRVAEAEAAALRALDEGAAADQPDAGVVFAAAIFLVRYDQGRLAEIVDIVEQAAHDNPGIPGLRATLALALTELDREAEARSLLLEEVETGFAGVPYDQFLIVTLMQWTLVAGALHAEHAAETLYELLAPWETQVAFTGAHVFGAVAHGLALAASTLRRFDDAERHFDHAASVYDDLDAPIWGARSMLARARMLLGRGDASDRERARVLVDRAAHVAAQFGCAEIERRAATLRAGIV